MPEALSDTQWAGIRAICEGELQTHARVAQAANIAPTTLSRRASREKWQSLDFRRPRVRAAQHGVAALSRRVRAGEELDPVDAEALEAEAWPDDATTDVLEPWPDEPPAQRIARIGAVLTKHTETILRRVEAGQPLESRQIAALSSLVQLAERIAVLAREEARQEEEDNDAELAETLREINEKIVYLAECEARRLAVAVFGIPQEEVDAKLPEPVEGVRRA